MPNLSGLKTSLAGFNWKKYLPFILVGVGLILLVAFYFLFLHKSGTTSTNDEDTSALINVAPADMPYTTLTPTDDGHWLHLKIDKIKIPGAESFDYELLYNLPTGEPQGVPGTIQINGQTTVERDLLLGSESSGHFRYDEGVAEGTLTLRFRNSRGQLLAKFESQFHLQSNTADLTSKDGKFSLTLDKTPTKTFFVTMPTFGVPGDLPSLTVNLGPYAVLTSSKTPLSGKVSLDGTIQMWSGTSWKALTNGKTTETGLFISTTSE